MIKVRKALPDEGENFIELILMTGEFSVPFGKNAVKILLNMFCTSSNLFSFEHVFFAEVNGEIAGMLLGYDWKTKKREDLKTAILLLRHLGINFLKRFPVLIELNRVFGKLERYEYYIQNVSVYPEYRRMGIGTKLMHKAEELAMMTGCKKLVLDVESRNVKAISFYRKLGYEITRKTPLRASTHREVVVRMTKDVCLTQIHGVREGVL